MAAYIFIQTPFGQNWIGRQIVKRLSNDLKTRVTVKHVDFSLLNRMHLQGLLVEDRHGDTLLYADDAIVRITDWFIFKKNIELKYLGLNNALIKFQRTDSNWSQQFLFDYFSSPSSNKTGGGINLNIKKLGFTNVTFIKKDAWEGEDLTAKIASLQLDANQVKLSDKIIDINTLDLGQPFVTINKYQGSKPELLNSDTSAAVVIDSLLQWNQDGWAMRIGQLTIDKGRFKTDKQSDQPILASFDGRHIDFDNVNGTFANVLWKGDSITAHVDLSTTERSGFMVKKLTADAVFTPHAMAFDKLNIQTNNSSIHHYFRMDYADFDSMGDFIHAVNMQSDFDDSEIDSDDIAFFAPSLKSWKKRFLLKGKIKGTVDALSGTGLKVKTNNSLLDGDLSLTGLPDINQTFIDLKSNDFRTTYGDAVTMLPVMRKVTQPDLRKIQYVDFRGNFTGFIRDFVTFGNIQTNLGSLTTDINMKFPAGHPPVYSGTVKTDNFRLGEFINDENIGSVAFSATLKGTGFNSNSRNAIIDGTVKFADYKGYRYQNITVKGRLDKKLFEGVAQVRDDNAEFDLNGKLDFNSKIPLFDLKATVMKSNLRDLKITEDDISFKGNLDFNFSGNDLDNFLGNARITNAELTRNGQRLPFDSLVLNSGYNDSLGKSLTVTSNEFSGTISGDFSVRDLPASFSYLLNKYYPSYIKAPLKIPANQSIAFDINTEYVDELVHLLDSNITGLNYSHLYGNMNLAKNELNLTASIPQFKYKQFNFDFVDIHAEGRSDNLMVKGAAHNIRINDSLSIPMASFVVNARNDSSKVSIVSGANRTVDTANLNALVLTYKDGIKIDFDRSTFTLNGKTWTVDENGQLEFRKTHPASGELVLREGEQKIMIKTQPSAKGDWNDLHIDLTKINVGDVSPYLLPKNRLEGLVSGTILIEDPTGNMKISSDNITTQFLRLDNDSLGEVKATLNYDKLTKELRFKGNTVNQENYLGFDGHVFIGDPNKAKDNNIVLNARNFQIKVLERFLGNLFSDMQGFLTGDVDLGGDFDNLAITGKGRLKDAGLRVNYTQVFYKIKDTDIQLTPQEINLDGIVLTDTVTGNPIYIKGGIEHESFRNMFYDIYITTRKPGTSRTDETNNRPVQLLNTTYRDNKQFYGDVKGTGSLSLAGPQEDMFMTIDAFASGRDSSFITIPSSTSRESGIADFLVEKKFGHEMSEIGDDNNLTNITYDVNVTIDPVAAQMTTVKVVLDDLTGDEIKGKGAGTLKIRSGTTEPLDLRGRFDIYEGNYLFTFQSFFKKPFELKKGADNYIEWTGDPYDARINLTATYTANNVSYSPLAAAWKGIDQKISNARGDVYVVAKLTDQLFNPKINFSLEFPPQSVVNDDPALAFSLQQLQKNDNEMNKQATYLVVFGIFAPVENTSGFSFQDVATNSLSGIFFNVINDQVKKIVSEIFKTDKYNFNFSSSLYNRNVIDATNKFNLGGNLNASLGRSFFKNRLILTVGGSLEGFVQSGVVEKQVGFLKDFSVEVLINESGSFRANLFYRENIDYLTTNTSGPGRMNRTGVGVSYRREGDTLWELLFGKKKKAAVNKQPTEVKSSEPGLEIKQN